MWCGSWAYARSTGLCSMIGTSHKTLCLSLVFSQRHDMKDPVWLGETRALCAKHRPAALKVTAVHQEILRHVSNQRRKTLYFYRLSSAEFCFFLKVLLSQLCFGLMKGTTALHFQTSFLAMANGKAHWMPVKDAKKNKDMHRLSSNVFCKMPWEIPSGYIYFLVRAAEGC